MIRKFFALVFILVLVVVMMPMLILQSISATFLDKESVKTIVEESYDPVTTLFAERFAYKPVSQSLLTERLRNFLPQAEYVELIGVALDSFLAQDWSKISTEEVLRVDLLPLKKRLKEIVPARLEYLPNCTADELESRSVKFCRYADMLPNKQLGDEMVRGLEGEIPSSFQIELGEIKDAKAFVVVTLWLKNYLLPLMIGLAIIILGILALIIYEPVYSIIKWLGVAFLGLCSALTLFLISLMRLPKIIPIYEGLTPAQADLAQFLLGQPISYLQKTAFLIGGLGVLLLVAGFMKLGRASARHKK